MRKLVCGCGNHQVVTLLICDIPLVRGDCVVIPLVRGNCGGCVGIPLSEEAIVGVVTLSLIPLV